MGDDSLLERPDDLPVPEDDGAADHLVGRQLPRCRLPSSAGRLVDISAVPGLTIIYCYPRTGIPGGHSIPGWDLIPGARGCTAEACGFRDHHAALLDAGVHAVFGLSTQSPADQLEAAVRLALPFELLSDHQLEFSDSLDLPRFEVAGMTLIRRLTVVADRGRVEHVFYPVFPPDRHANEVLAWLSVRGLDTSAGR